ILIRHYTGVEIKLISGEQFKITNPNIERLQIKDVEIPVEYTLMQNYPNPFNPTTTIKFGIPEKTNVQLEIYSLIGERIAEPINTVLEAGYHEINWDASHLASGIYIYKLITNRFSNVKKMIFIK
ncbi:MAG: T9SS type A sorting domain-containing protein, partial [Melioribacteraceae bacterium]